MLQCKIFSGEDYEQVQQEVNKFLHEHAKNIIHSVVQSASQSNIQITILFNVRSKAAKMKEAAIAEVAFPIKQGEINTN